MIDGATAKVADDFFARLVERLGGAPQAVPLPAIPADAVRRRLWFRAAIIVLILVVLAIYWLTRPA